MAEQLGWSVRGVEPEAVIADTGYPAADGRAELWLDGDAVTEISVNLTGIEVGGGPVAVEFRRDAFADASGALQAVYGKSAERRPGRLPETSWRRSGQTRRPLPAQAPCPPGRSARRPAPRQR